MNTKIRKIFANCVSALIPFRAPRNKIRQLIKAGAVRKAIRKYVTTSMKEEACLSFPNFLSVCAIAKNEGRYFQEWLEYHSLIGVEKFYIYDNDSNDDTYAVLKPYIERGIVEYVKFPGDKMQRPAYRDCLERCKYETKWLATIDLDEFIVPVKTNNIQTFLKKLPGNVAQVLLGWVIYGSSGHENKPDGLVMENYLHRAEHNWQYKPIVNPRMVLLVQATHDFLVMRKTVDEHGLEILRPLKYKFTHDVARINHYHCKSWEEYQIKLTRGDAFYGKDKNKHNRFSFDANDKNEVFDPTIAKYIEETKKRLTTLQ